MPRVQFDTDLEGLRAIAGRMGALVEVAIRDSVTCLRSRDIELAARVVEGDAEVDALHHQLRDEVMRVLATQAPVARDLRLVVGLLYIGAELERIGDYATRIAKRSRRLADEPQSGVYVELEQMASLVELQVHDILDAFVRVDKVAAAAVAGRDDAIDKLYHRVFGEQMSNMTNEPEFALRSQYIVNIAHTLERIGDRVTNVAEDIIFLDTGQVVELD
ncbi:MAG: phosphate signaling complex protein PhoU [Candidatus Dormibacteria bacterium]